MPQPKRRPQVFAPNLGVSIAQRDNRLRNSLVRLPKLMERLAKAGNFCVTAPCEGARPAYVRDGVALATHDC
jgi:hypothetical protein